ncbi:MAG: hypothetical protein PHG87_00580 [Candidatus Omnitrophica bacterium]|nr:hypothetical protein [Candidatus Omnitrophota bacterium]
MQTTKIRPHIIFGAILIGIILSYLYSQMVVIHPQDNFKEIREIIYWKDTSFHLALDLTKDSYFLRIKHDIQEGEFKDIFMNGVVINSDIAYHVKKKGSIQSTYFYLPKEIIKSGVNSVDINFFKNNPSDIDIMLTNYRRNISDDIYILFSDSVHSPSGMVSIYVVISVMVLVYILFVGVPYFVSGFTPLSIDKLFLYQVYSISPFLISLIISCIFSKINGYFKVVFTQAYFLNFAIVSFSIVETFIILGIICKGVKERFALSMKVQIPIKSGASLNVRLNVFDWWLIQWAGSRKFSDKCILLFMVFLMGCPILLFLHLDTIAEQFAKVSSFFLISGLIIKFLKLKKEENNKI